MNRVQASKKYEAISAGEWLLFISIQNKYFANRPIERALRQTQDKPRLAALSNGRFFGTMNNMEKKINKFIYWTPRILSIMFLLFLAMFSLDVFDSASSFWGTVLALFMHNIPAFVLLIVLLISWKYEIVGGIGFFLAGILYIVIMAVNAIRSQFEWYQLSWSLIIAGPAFLVGILFFVNWLKKRGVAMENKS